MNRNLVVGVDGGGTKTHAVVMRADAGSDNQILGEGIAGPSNPLRSGIAAAANAVRESIALACADASVETAQIAAAEIGLAGVRKADVRARVRESLVNLNISPVLHVTTDADIALYGATLGEAGLVVIAGTGSVCCGQDAKGRRAYAGGWGPLAGDEGSAAWIARQTLQRVAQAADGREYETALTSAVKNYFGLTTLDDLASVIYSPTMTHARIAGLTRFVIEAARAGDAAAKEIITDAGRELGRIAAAVARQLNLTDKELRVAYVGGVFAAGELVLAPMRRELASLAETVKLTPPALAPAEAAAQMARKMLIERLALAG